MDLLNHAEVPTQLIILEVNFRYLDYNLFKVIMCVAVHRDNNKEKASIKEDRTASKEIRIRSVQVLYE